MKTFNEAGLTPREIEVLRELVEGATNVEIAKSLRIGVDTAKEHVHNILAKLGVDNRTKAAVWAVRATNGKRDRMAVAIQSAARYMHDATRWDQRDEVDEDGVLPMDRLLNELMSISNCSEFPNSSPTN